MRPICLIIPPSPFLLDERVFMSLGILRVAAVLQERGYKPDVLDLSGITNPRDVIRTYFMSAPADTVYGITATTPQLPAAVRLSEEIRAHNSTSRIVLGGPHVTLTYAAWKRERANGIVGGRAGKSFDKIMDHFDTFVAGDGEEAIFVAIKESAPKFIDADDPTSQLFLTPHRLSQLPFPARDLVDVSSYHHDVDGKNALNVILQLGCPFGCGFCGGRLSPSFRRVRLRSTENVLDEIRHIHKRYGSEALMFHDDELNVNPNFLKLLRGLISLQDELGAAFHFRGFIKAQLFTDEQAELMYRAGFRRILVGFEAANPRILKNIQKSSTLEQNTRCMEIADRHHLKVKALMSLGHPGESPETVEAVKDWLIKVRPHDFDVTVITTYFGTPYHDNAVPHATLPGVWTYTINGDCLHSYDVDYSVIEDYYKGKPDEGYVAYVFTDFISSEELVRMRDIVEREVRTSLNIPYYQAGNIAQYEHSMGQGLPGHILRRSL